METAAGVKTAEVVTAVDVTEEGLGVARPREQGKISVFREYLLSAEGQHPYAGFVGRRACLLAN